MYVCAYVDIHFENLKLHEILLRASSDVINISRKKYNLLIRKNVHVKEMSKFSLLQFLSYIIS